MATLRRPLLARVPAATPGLVLAAALAVLVLVVANPQVLRGDLIDTDSYMHVVRLRSFVADWNWHGGFFPRDNAPYGLVVYWTKAYDLLYLALIAPIAPFVGWQSAVVLVAPAIGPLSIFVLILTGIWAAAPICDAAERRIVGVVLALAPMMLVFGAIGNADYHVVVVAACLVFLGFALRVALGGGVYQGLWAGVAAALALWLSVECILGVSLGIALMGLAWIRDGARLRRAILAFAVAFPLGMAAALAFDPPNGDWLRLEAGRISILYLAFACLLALLWAGMALAPQAPRAWRARLAVASVGVVLSAMCLAALFPGVLAPERAVFGGDDELRFWNEVGEMQPAFRHPGAGVMFVGGAAIGLVAAIGLAWRDRRKPAGLAWAMLAVMLAFLTALGLRHLRFVTYPEALAALPIAMLMTRIGPFIDEVSPTYMRAFGRVVVAAAVFVGPFLLAGVVAAATENTQPARSNCAVRVVAPALNDPAFMEGRDLILMTQPIAAAELLYWTGHRVVDAPFHTDVEGIHGITHDLIQFMTSRDDVAARAIVERRGIDYVMLCPSDRTGADAAGPDGRELYSRLLSGQVPGWLRPRPWPAGVASDLLLYRVVPSGGPK